MSRRHRMTVISELQRDERGLVWVVSATSIQPGGPGRPSDRQLKRVRRDFGMYRAEEDNHMPGAARFLYLMVDPSLRGECECKVAELVVVEPDGYEWTTPRDGECRGCTHARLFAQPCPIHGEVKRGQ